MSLSELAISDENFFMEYVNGEYILKKGHTYYYQVQLQMFLTKAKACYFFVYSREVSLCWIIFFFMKHFWSKKYLLRRISLFTQFYQNLKEGGIPELMWHHQKLKLMWLTIRIFVLAKIKIFCQILLIVQINHV